MKSIVITGAAGGMGAAATKALAETGYRVFAIDLAPIEAVEGVIPIKADLTSEGSVAAAFETIRASCDRVFAILHFAGLYMLDSFVEIGTEAFDRIFDVNFRGVFLVNKVFRPLLGDGSRILITTSELAPLDPLPFTGIYAVSKAALDRYAFSLAMELQLLGIRVSVLRAGAVRTAMLGTSTEALSRFCRETALYRTNSARFQGIVARVEARCVPPEAIAKRCLSILGRKKPKFAYAINRNPLLLLLNLLPKRLQLYLIGRILK